MLRVAGDENQSGSWNMTTKLEGRERKQFEGTKNTKGPTYLTVYKCGLKQNRKNP